MGSKRVIADPEYQRRVVWDDKKKDELLKSNFELSYWNNFDDKNGIMKT